MLSLTGLRQYGCVPLTFRLRSSLKVWLPDHHRPLPPQSLSVSRFSPAPFGVCYVWVGAAQSVAKPAFTSLLGAAPPAADFPLQTSPSLAHPPLRIRGILTEGGTSSQGGLKIGIHPVAPLPIFSPNSGHSAGRVNQSSALRNQAGTSNAGGVGGKWRLVPIRVAFHSGIGRLKKLSGELVESLRACSMVWNAEGIICEALIVWVPPTRPGGGLRMSRQAQHPQSAYWGPSHICAENYGSELYAIQDVVKDIFIKAFINTLSPVNTPICCV